jgi:hypothetical protein
MKHYLFISFYLLGLMIWNKQISSFAVHYAECSFRGTAIKNSCFAIPQKSTKEDSGLVEGNAE